MIINIHAGHNPDGKTACGAVGLMKESTQAREVVKRLIPLLQAAGHTVYDCTCNDGSSQGDVLKRIVAKCNTHTADLDISVHFNSGSGDTAGNSVTTGTEVYVYDTKGAAYAYACKIAGQISALGFQNRGVKVRRDLYVLNTTKAPAMLIECCFVDDLDDCKLYNPNTMAQAIARGITGEEKKTMTMEEGLKIIKDKCQFDDNTMNYLQYYRYAESLIVRIAERMK